MLSPLLMLLGAATPTIGDAVHQAIAPCPAPSPSGEIIVCKRQEEKDRYRPAPPSDRGFDTLGPTDSVSRERYRLMDADGLGQDLTRGSCSSVGASGATGCMIKTWREHDQMKGW